MDLNQFSKRIGKLSVEVSENSDKLVRKVAMAADNAVVLATPVDKGGARANWIASLDAPAIGTIENFTVGAAQEAIDRNDATIAGYDGDKNTEINITNNLPYIGELNRGTSAQAPADFVNIAVLVGTKAIDGAKLLS